MDEHPTQPEPASADRPLPVLDPVEVRVLGCLIEKEVATPEYYPLTLNALVAACNQKSNRDPAMALDESDVERALDHLRFTHRMVALVHTAGSRVQKFRHTLPEVYPLDPSDLAVLCELFVRGPQTPGELRTRASRLHPFPDLEAVEATLGELETHPAGALVVKLPREPGRREARFMHCLGGEPDPVAQEAAMPAAHASPGGRVAALEEQVARLQTEVAELKTLLADLRHQLGVG